MKWSSHFRIYAHVGSSVFARSYAFYAIKLKDIRLCTNRTSHKVLATSRSCTLCIHTALEFALCVPTCRHYTSFHMYRKQRKRAKSLAEWKDDVVIDEKQVEDDDADDVEHAYVHILLSCMSRKCHQISYYSSTACTAHRCVSLSLSLSLSSEASAMVNKCSIHAIFIFRMCISPHLHLLTPASRMLHQLQQTQTHINRPTTRAHMHTSK